MNLTIQQLLAIMPKAPTEWLEPLKAAMAEFEINTPQRVAAFLANLAHESVELRITTENLAYSAEGLLKTWPAKFNPPDIARKYARHGILIANRAYAGRLGNGDEASGDGWRFRGRSPLQLTGRQNYREVGQALGIDLENEPDLALQPKIGARVAGHFWKSHGLNELADTGNFEGTVKGVNGPRMLGLTERTTYYNKALKVLGG